MKLQYDSEMVGFLSLLPSAKLKIEKQMNNISHLSGKWCFRPSAMRGRFTTKIRRCSGFCLHMRSFAGQSVPTKSRLILILVSHYSTQPCNLLNPAQLQRPLYKGQIKPASYKFCSPQVLSITRFPLLRHQRAQNRICQWIHLHAFGESLLVWCSRSDHIF